MAAEGGGGGDSLSDAAHTVKRLAGMKRSYNVEIKLMSDPASKVTRYSGVVTDRRKQEQSCPLKFYFCER